MTFVAWALVGVVVVLWIGFSAVEHALVGIAGLLKQILVQLGKR